MAYINVIQNTEIAESSTAKILEPDRHSALYWFINTLVIVKEKNKLMLVWSK